LEPLEHARFAVSKPMILTTVAPLVSHASPPQLSKMLAWPTNAISLTMGKLGVTLLTRNAQQKTNA